MEEKEHVTLERAMVELDSHIAVYYNRAQTLWKGSNQERYESDMRRYELLRFIRNEVAGIIPRHTVIQDGKYYCPSCGSEVGALYPAADKANIPMNFCPCCMQSFEGRV